MIKQWRWLADHPSYMVSDQGDVRRRRVNSPLLVGDTDPKGYRRVLIEGKHRRVARLVCESFHGRCPPGHECGHLNGNKEDNSAANLAWVTRSENGRHAVLHGTHRGAENLTPGNTARKYSDELRAEMRASGMGARRLSKAYGISKSHAGRILAESGDAQPSSGNPQ